MVNIICRNSMNIRGRKESLEKMKRYGWSEVRDGISKTSPSYVYQA